MTTHGSASGTTSASMGYNSLLDSFSDAVERLGLRKCGRAHRPLAESIRKTGRQSGVCGWYQRWGRLCFDQCALRTNRPSPHLCTDADPSGFGSIAAGLPEHIDKLKTSHPQVEERTFDLSPVFDQFSQTLSSEQSAHRELALANARARCG